MDVVKNIFPFIFLAAQEAIFSFKFLGKKAIISFMLMEVNARRRRVGKHNPSLHASFTEDGK